MLIGLVVLQPVGWHVRDRLRVLLRQPGARQRPLKRFFAVAALLFAACSCKRSPPSLSPEAERAVAYFVARGENIDPIIALLSDYLRRKHKLTGLDSVVAQLKNPKLDPKHPDKELAFHLRTYARLADPAANPPPEELARASNSLDRLALETLYCDRNGVGVNLEARLRDLAALGGYMLTHAALYAAWALENNCLENTRVRALLAEFAGAMATLAESQGTTDLGMEAMAMLYYTGHRNRVRPEWVAEVKQFQRADGGWTHGPVGPTNDHSSLFGLWVLLEAQRPGVPDVPWFKRP